MTEQADLETLYPFLHGAAQEPKKLDAALLRSIDDAENAGALNSTIADIVRGLVHRFPIEQLISVLQQLTGV